MTNEINKSSFGSLPNYSIEVRNRQPEHYDETARILDSLFTEFHAENGRAPVVVDVGGAGVITFDPGLVKSVHILDLFEKAGAVELPENAHWIVGDITKQQTLPQQTFDFVLFNSVIHHLGAPDMRNFDRLVKAAFFNSSNMLNKNGKVVVIESTTSPFLARAQDLLMPITSFILHHFFNFPLVRMLSDRELSNCLTETSFTFEQVHFRQPKKVAVIHFSIPAYLYPVKIRCLVASSKKLLQ